MYDQSSRYMGYDSEDEIKLLLRDDGHKIRYLKRRFIPDTSKGLYKEYSIKGNDRIDLMAQEMIGDPLQFWKICDANNVMHPLELARKIGQTIKIPANMGFEI